MCSTIIIFLAIRLYVIYSFSIYSKNAQAEVKADYWAIFDLPEDAQPGPDAVAKAQAKIDSFATRWRDSYPAAVRCLLDVRDSLTVYLRFPREHWTRVRHSNFIEHTSARRAAE